MQKSSLVALFVVFLTGVCHSQELNDPFSQSQGVSQGASQGSIDCSDPSMAESPTCSGAQGQRGNTAPSGEFPSSTMRTPTLNTPYGFTPDQYTPTRPPLNPSQIWRPQMPTRPETEFEQMVADSVGRPLPLFGQSLFVQAPSTFSPVDFMQVPSDYIIGRLRSIQVVVVGNARYPGTYTISSLSTLVNAIFASGGPTPQGSLRHILVRRDGATITDFDFYALLIKGDKSKDVRLLPGDVLHIPHVGPLVAMAGSVNSPAIYEARENSTLDDLIEIAGGLSTVADTS